LVWLYSWVKGTRAFRILLGLGLLLLVFFWAQFLGLFLTGRLFDWMAQGSLILIIVVFATEIRQVLERINPFRVWSQVNARTPDFIEETVAAVQHFAAHRIGALLVFERSDRLREQLRPGVPLNGEIRRETLISLFQPGTLTHDGAAWIREGRLLEVAAFLPISHADLPLQYGSRHRAAVGITEVSDAMVVVVSEERGEVSWAEEGRLRRVGDFERLTEDLRKGLHLFAPGFQPTWRSVLVKDWKIKLLTFCLVTPVWLALAGQQPSEEAFSARVRYLNLPPGVSLTAPPPAVTVRVAGPRRKLAGLTAAAIEVRVDASRVVSGDNSLALRPDLVTAPPGFSVVQVQPQLIQIRAVRGVRSEEPASRR
jgi:uncharacterized protein (TIGR00159 family)